jgi:hypothetical protein
VAGSASSTPRHTPAITPASAHPPLPPPLPPGRRGKTGIATTFINKAQSELTLLDLKHLLREAKQRIPPVLQALHDPMDELMVRGRLLFVLYVFSSLAVRPALLPARPGPDL